MGMEKNVISELEIKNSDIGDNGIIWRGKEKLIM
jgi:hypothetical protein